MGEPAVGMVQARPRGLSWGTRRTPKPPSPLLAQTLLFFCTQSQAWQW